MRKVLDKYCQIVDRMSEWLGWLTVMIVTLTIIIGFYNVVARYLGRFIEAQLSSNFYIELQWYLYSLVFLLGFGYCLKHGVNVRVDFLSEKFSIQKKAMIDFWGHILFLIPFCLLGIYVTISPVLVSWGRLPNGSWGAWELSPDPSGLPRAPIKTMIIIGLVLLLLQAISELIQLWPVMRGHEATKEIEEELGLLDQPLRIE